MFLQRWQGSGEGGIIIIPVIYAVWAFRVEITGSIPGIAIVQQHAYCAKDAIPAVDIRCFVTDIRINDRQQISLLLIQETAHRLEILIVFW